MAKAGWGNQRQELPPGKYLAQIVKCEAVRVKSLKDPSKLEDRFKFTVDIQVNGEWETRSIYTGQNFTDESQQDDPQFISGLNKLTRAAGLKVPQTLEEVEEFDTDLLEGRQFVWAVVQDEETHKIQRKYLRLRQQPAAVETEAAPPPTAPARRQSGAAVPPQGAAERAEQAPNYATATVRRPAPAPAAATAGRNSHARTVDHSDPFA